MEQHHAIQFIFWIKLPLFLEHLKILSLHLTHHMQDEDMLHLLFWFNDPPLCQLDSSARVFSGIIQLKPVITRKRPNKCVVTLHVETCSYLFMQNWTGFVPLLFKVRKLNMPPPYQPTKVSHLVWDFNLPYVLPRPQFSLIVGMVQMILWRSFWVMP